MTRPGEAPRSADAGARPDDASDAWWAGADGPDADDLRHGPDVDGLDGHGGPDLDDLDVDGFDDPAVGGVTRAGRSDVDDEPVARRPIRWGRLALGLAVPVVVFAGFEGAVSALLLRQSEGAGLTTLVVWMPLGILLLSLLTAVGAVVAHRRGDRGLALGLLIGLAPGLVVGSAITLAVLDAGTGLG
jgi:hypothetical protein